jgi:hypothetical protein
LNSPLNRDLFPSFYEKIPEPQSDEFSGFESADDHRRNSVISNLNGSGEGLDLKINMNAVYKYNKSDFNSGKSNRSDVLLSFLAAR